MPVVVMLPFGEPQLELLGVHVKRLELTWPLCARWFSRARTLMCAKEMGSPRSTGPCIGTTGKSRIC